MVTVSRHVIEQPTAEELGITGRAGAARKSFSRIALASSVKNRGQKSGRDKK